MSGTASASVGIVIVSHSSKIAEGVVELAAQMAADTRLIAAGGTDDGRIGTSFDLVSAAIAEADGGAGVVVLGDLGSAILTAETALDFLDDGVRECVRIADAPLVEGAVAAAVAAQTGGDLVAVLTAAESARGASIRSVETVAAVPATTSATHRTVTLINLQGLHARPASQFAAAAAGFDADVTVNGINAKSLLAIMAMGAAAGAELVLDASGPQAAEAVTALAELVESGFGED